MSSWSPDWASNFLKGKFWKLFYIFSDKMVSILINIIQHEQYFLIILLTLSWRRPLSFRNQSIHLLRKSMEWFLYDNGLRHERVNTSWRLRNVVSYISFVNEVRTCFACICRSLKLCRDNSIRFWFLANAQNICNLIDGDCALWLKSTN